jgi:SAM-dependent methyltransferase
MKLEKQVKLSHYEFDNYMPKQRWCSVWHQLYETHKLKPEKVLEIGAGPGLFKAVAAVFGVRVETLDIDPDLKPDYIGSINALPFDDNEYDVVCAFQVLEHMPYELSLEAFKEMVRVSRRYILVSLPDIQYVHCYKFNVPIIGAYNFNFRWRRFNPPEHKFDGEHYWEINKRGYSLSKVINDFSNGIQLLKTYQVREHHYHRFFIFKKN